MCILKYRFVTDHNNLFINKHPHEHAPSDSGADTSMALFSFAPETERKMG